MGSLVDPNSGWAAYGDRVLTRPELGRNIRSTHGTDGTAGTVLCRWKIIVLPSFLSYFSMTRNGSGYRMPCALEKRCFCPKLDVDRLSGRTAGEQSLRMPAHYFGQTLSRCNWCVAKILSKSFGYLGWNFLSSLSWMYTKKLSSLKLEVLRCNTEKLLTGFNGYVQHLLHKVSRIKYLFLSCIVWNIETCCLSGPVACLLRKWPLLPTLPGPLSVFKLWNLLFKHTSLTGIRGLQS